VKIVFGLYIVDNNIVDINLAKNADQFLNIFTEDEKNFTGKKWKSHLAARLAAKNAVCSILGINIEILLTNVFVHKNSSGTPHIILTGNAAEQARKLKLNRWYLSLTHTDRYAAAFVAAEELI
jgi:phosphopantetheine--protein transferase-like protein